MENVSNALSEAGKGAEAFLQQEFGGGTSSSPEATSQPVDTTVTNATPQQPSTVQTQPQQPAQQPSAPATGPTPLTLDDATTYLWTNPETGTTEPKTGKDIKAGWMMQASFTKKTQELAGLRKQIEPYINERQQLAEILQNPERYARDVLPRLGPQAVQQLQQALAAMQQPQQPQFNPNELATTGQAQELAQRHAQAQFAQMQQQLAAMQEQLQQNVAASAQQIRDEQEIRRHSEQLAPVVKGLLEEHPILNAVPRAEDNIRFEVLQWVQTQTALNNGVEPPVAEAIAKFKEVGSRYAQGLTTKFEELQKAQAAKAQALVTNGIEPPGGAPVQHQGLAKTPVKPNGRADFEAINKAAAAFLEQSLSK